MLIGALPLIGVLGSLAAALFISRFTERPPHERTLGPKALRQGLKGFTFAWPAVHIVGIVSRHRIPFAAMSLISAGASAVVLVLGLLYLRELFLDGGNALAARRAERLALCFVGLVVIHRVAWYPTLFNMSHRSESVAGHRPSVAYAMMGIAALVSLVGDVVVATLTFVLTRELRTAALD